MTPLQTRIVGYLYKHADQHNEVTVLFADVAAELGDVSHGDVLQALIHLKSDGYFPGTPIFSIRQFNGHLP